MRGLLRRRGARGTAGLPGRYLVVAWILAAFVARPVAAQQQEEPAAARLTIRVISSGGEALTAGEVRLEEIDGEGGPAESADAFAITSHRTVLVLDVDPDRRYRLIIEAPGHESRTLEFVARAGTRALRFVLPVDPFRLPEIEAAAASAGAALRGRAVSHIRFDRESLTYATVGEWLADAPGVALRRRGAGGHQFVTVRGSRPEDVLVLLDGSPVNDPLTGRADLSSLATSTLETATLLRGASSGQHGSGATAGVLLLTSRQATGLGGRVGMHAESYGRRGLDLQLGTGGARGAFGLTLALSRASNDYAFENRAVPGHPVETRRNADLSSLHAGVNGTLSSMHASVRLDRSDRGTPGRMGTTLFDEARATDLSWIASTGWAGNEGSVSGSYRNQRLRYRQGPGEDTSVQRVEEARLSAQITLLEEGSVPVTVGGRVVREHARGDDLEGDPARATGGLSTAATFRLSRLRLDPSVSLDLTEAGAALSPGLAVTWSADAGWRTWARAGRAFRLPTFGDLYFASAYRVRPNPDLEPERVTLDAEVGAAVDSRRGSFHLSASGSLWYRRIESPVVWLASAVAVWSPRNLGELESRGVEVEATLTRNGGDVAGWRVQLAGSMERSRVGFGTNRNPVPYQPGIVGRFTFEGWRGDTGVRLDVRHTGSRTTSIAATRRLPSFLTLDLSGRRTVAVPGLELGFLVRIENVLDRRYELIELFPEPGRRLQLRVETRSRHP